MVASFFFSPWLNPVKDNRAYMAGCVLLALILHSYSYIEQRYASISVRLNLLSHEFLLFLQWKISHDRLCNLLAMMLLLHMCICICICVWKIGAALINMNFTLVMKAVMHYRFVDRCFSSHTWPIFFFVYERHLRLMPERFSYNGIDSGTC